MFMPIQEGQSARKGNLPMDVMYFGFLKLEGTEHELTPDQIPVVIALLELRDRYMYIVSYEARLVHETLREEQQAFLQSLPYTRNPDIMVTALWKDNVGRVRDALRKKAGVDQAAPLPLPDTSSADYDRRFGPQHLAHFLIHFFELEARPDVALSAEQASTLLPALERHWLILPRTRPNDTISRILSDSQKEAVDRVVSEYRNRRVHLLEDTRTLYRRLKERSGKP